MKFSHSDLLDVDTASRLRVIVFYKMKRDMMGSFHELLSSEKRQFNTLLNEYITSLPEEEWAIELKREFDEIVLKKILNSDFNAKNSFCPEINTEIKEVNASEEEKEHSL